MISHLQHLSLGPVAQSSLKEVQNWITGENVCTALGPVVELPVTGSSSVFMNAVDL